MEAASGSQHCSNLLNGIITGELTRDYLNGRSCEPLQRRLRLLPWQVDDMSHLSYEQHEDDDLFTSVCALHVIIVRASSGLWGCSSFLVLYKLFACLLNFPTYFFTTYLLHYLCAVLRIGNESVLKIIVNNTINLFFKTAIGILVISNHNSFRVLFDKIASMYFYCKIYLYFSIGSGQSRAPALCKLYQYTFIPYRPIPFPGQMS